MNSQYESPLSTRYASKYMLELFSNDNRYQLFRKLWVSLAKAEKKLGLPITDYQINEMEAHINDIDYDCVKKREKEVRHDVMAHVYAFGEVAKSAAGIIHLGATSCYVTDNADLIIYRDALVYIREELLKTIASLAAFADKYKSLPTLGYTHYQPAQFVTVGKRATLWIQNFVSDYQEINHILENLKFLGCRGTVGTEASFLDLFDGDNKKIDEMNKMICSDFNFKDCFDVCGQTYPRKMDSLILNCLSSIAQSAYRMASDIRLLQHDRQIEEPFEKNQIGSSAMAYKRNPMRSERICSLSRYLITNALNAHLTASSQWLERTLDDSANKRICVPEAFLAVDAILILYANISSGIVVYENVIKTNMMQELPFMGTEEILMNAVLKGGDRQELHEKIRIYSMEAGREVKEFGRPNDLVDRIAADETFGLSKEEILAALNPDNLCGRSKNQVTDFIENQVNPVLEKYKNYLDVQMSEVNV